MRGAKRLASLSLVVFILTSIFASFALPKKVYAASYSDTCKSTNPDKSVTITVTATYNGFVGNVLTSPATVSYNVSSSSLFSLTGSTPTVSLYRAAASDGNYSEVDRNTAPLKIGSSYTGNFTNSMPAGNYKYFVRASINAGLSGETVGCSAESGVYTSSGNSGDDTKDETPACKAAAPKPTEPTPTVDYVKNTIFKGSYEPRDEIKFRENPNGDTCPPYATLYNTSDEPKNLDFVFTTLVDARGSATFDNYYFWFKSTKYNDLWIIIDDNAQYVMVIASAAGSEKGTEIMGDLGVTALSSSVIEDRSGFNRYLYSRVFNVCGAGNCTKGDYRTVTDYPNTQSEYIAGVNGKLAPNYAMATKTNTNAQKDGKPINKQAWLDVWGVTGVDSTYDLGGQCGIGILASFGLGQMITRALACTAQFFFNAIYQPVTDALKGLSGETASLETELSQRTGSLVQAWEYSRSLVDVIVILALLAIAFANIFHLNLNTYGAKKALPGLVLGVVGANASLLIIRFIMELVTVVMRFSYEIANVTDLSGLLARFIAMLGGAFFSNNFVNVAATTIFIILIIIFGVYFFFLIIIFAWAMVKRLVYLYACIILAPLAFAAYGLPSMQQWFFKWWDTFLRQAFSLPIVLVAAAVLIRYATSFGFTFDATTLANNDTAGILKAVLIMAFAGAILKLPGAITKGALDITNAAKKAWGIAKKSPTSTYAGAMSADKFIRGGGAHGLAAKLANTKVGKKLISQEAAQGLKERAREMRLSYKTPKRLSNLRGRSYLATNPNLLIDYYKERGAASDKDSVIAAAKTGIPNKIRGAAGTFKSEASFAEEGLAKAEGKEDFSQWIESNLPGGMSEEGIFMKLESQLATKEPKERNSFMAKLRSARDNEEVQKILDQLGIDETIDAKAATQLKQLYLRMNVKAKQQRLQEKGNLDVNEDIKNSRVNPARGELEYKDAPSTGSSAYGEGVRISDISQAAATKISSVAGIASVMNESASGMEERLWQHMQDWQQFDNYSDEDRLENAEGIDRLVEATRESLVSTLDQSRDESQQLIAHITEALDNRDSGAIQRALQEFSLAAGTGNDANAIAERVIAAQEQTAMIQQHNKEIAASFKDEDIAKIGELLNGSVEELSGALGDKLSDPLKKIADATRNPDLLKRQEQIFTKMAQDLKQSMIGRGPTSLKSALGNLGSSLAKTIGMQELHPEPVIKVIADQQGGPQPMSQTVDTPPENPTT